MQDSPVDYGAMKALIALSNKQLAQFIWHFLRSNGVHQAQVVGHSTEAVNRMVETEFTHMFVCHELEAFGGCDFTKFVRMCDGKVSEAHVILVMSNPNREKVLEARDAGVSEVLCVPFTNKQLERRLEHIVQEPREFIRAATYIGPCRRRGFESEYLGVDRRKIASDTDKPSKSSEEQPDKKIS